ncbi:hypothetical protein FK268_01635 [Tsukamurella sputi]|uniref:Uncharacterized protein n=1 Tax=Tsukamurella sputi TaxID=2591848 RepID=A0A5C5RTR5_9ACTN|nr:hypothetical protein [Tsukamurella sputi]TWS25978.1 hypothetical protein FK268_01635 [Tsukamurella sputi]
MSAKCMAMFRSVLVASAESIKSSITAQPSRLCSMSIVYVAPNALSYRVHHSLRLSASRFRPIVTIAMMAAAVPTMIVAHPGVMTSPPEEIRCC